MDVRLPSEKVGENDRNTEFQSDQSRFFVETRFWKKKKKNADRNIWTGRECGYADAQRTVGGTNVASSSCTAGSATAVHRSREWFSDRPRYPRDLSGGCAARAEPGVAARERRIRAFRPCSYNRCPRECLCVPACVQGVGFRADSSWAEGSHGKRSVFTRHESVAAVRGSDGRGFKWLMGGGVCSGAEAPTGPWIHKLTGQKSSTYVIHKWARTDHTRVLLLNRFRVRASRTGDE